MIKKYKKIYGKGSHLDHPLRSDKNMLSDAEVKSMLKLNGLINNKTN